jgi:hypothetical protein
MGVWRYASATYPHSDIVGGLQFCATMQLRTPLRVLTRHGEIFTGLPGDPPVIAREQWEGTWITKMRTLREMGIDMDEPANGWIASNIGPIPADGGQYLQFLISVRRIVESVNSIDERIEKLKVEVGGSRWAEFSGLLYHSPLDIADYFFPAFLHLIPKLSRVSIGELGHSGLDNPAALDVADDPALLAVRGIGPKILAEIRAACACVTFERERNRIDKVTR